MRTICQLVLMTIVAAILCRGASADEPPASGKGTKAKGAKAKAPRVIDPFDRPEGSIVDQTARYYVWYDTKGWHLRATAKGTRTFSGTIKVKASKIKSCLPVGLKDGNQKGSPDTWQVNDARSELRFQFKTSNKSDGFDVAVEGTGEVEFDLGIDSQKKANTIFIGNSKQHPDKVPFSLPAAPKKTSE